MDISVKKAACEAMGDANLFTATTINTFNATSSYKVRKQWTEKVQETGTVKSYISSWETKIARQKRQAFKDLRMIQLREFISSTTDEQLLKYQRIVLAFYDANASGDFAKLRDLMYKVEEKLINRFSAEEGAAQEDIKKFLMTAVLFSPNAHQYSWETKCKALALCARLA